MEAVWRIGRRLWRWWRAPYRREQRMLVLQEHTLDEMVIHRAIMRIIMNDLRGLESDLDAVASRLAVAHGDIADLSAISFESAQTLKALAEAVLALRGDMAKVDIQIDIDKLRVKAQAALSQANDVIAATEDANAALKAAEDQADDALEPAAPTAPVEPQPVPPEVVTEPAPVVEPAPVEVEPPVIPPVENAPPTDPVPTEEPPAVVGEDPVPTDPVPTEGAGDVVVDFSPSKAVE